MPTIKIVFRGLMVLNRQSNEMEIGFLDALYNSGNGHVHSEHTSAVPSDHDCEHELEDPFEDTIEAPPVHVPRILTVKDGILTAIFDLRNRQELGTVRNWQLVVTNPVVPIGAGSSLVAGRRVTTLQTGTPFDRRTHLADRDFRWITDLEADDLHGRVLTSEINTRNLLMVLYVRHGDFYTKLKSPTLRRRRSGVDDGIYGCSAAVVGCDITFADGGSVKLVAGGTTGAEVFEFTPDDNTVFEISNGPPDVPVEGPIPLDAPGHFHMYYEKLFNPPHDELFDLTMDDRAPAPDPTLCGVIFLGRRSDPL